MVIATRRNISITDGDRSVLGPLAEHRILTLPQLALLLGVAERTAARRLQRLHDARLLTFQRTFSGLPPAASIRARGLAAIGSTLRPPQANLNEYRHDVGVAWLWLAARAGGFGELTAMTSDRRMQAADAAARAVGAPPRHGIGVGLIGPHGRPQQHYPDLVLETGGGHRVAVELELTAKSSSRMGRIMSAYASDARIDAVIYLVPNRALAELVGDTARRHGIGDRVHVQRLARDGIAGAEIGDDGSRSAQHATARARRSVRERASEPASAEL